MIKLFKETSKDLLVIDDQSSIFDKIEENMWIHMINPSLEDITKLHQKTGISMTLLQSAIDEEETAHLDLDDLDTLIVVDIPYIEEGYYTTLPFSIIYNPKYYVTICTKDANLVSSVLQKFRKVEPHKHVRLTLQILYRISSMFISSLKKIDDQTKKIEKTLHSSMRNKELFTLMEINKSFVYFSTSLNSDKIVLNKLCRLSEYKLYEDDFELMEDVTIEYNQAIEMCSIYRDILAGTMDAFASIISNNLNIVMKILAIITLIISIPTLVASFWGMNVKVPLQNNDFGFYIVLSISFVLSLIGAFILIKYSGKVKK